jgi:hypothetical protein
MPVEIQRKPLAAAQNTQQSCTMAGHTSTEPPALIPVTADEVAAILRERGWLAEAASPDMQAWLERAAAYLGPRAVQLAGGEPAAARAALAELLGLVFSYDARAILASPEAHLVLLREGARDVLRELAHLILDGGDVDSDRLKGIVAALRKKTGRGSRLLFRPLRLALAGRAGEGELDRVILLLDAAARLPFSAPVKGVRQRMLEFCAALD